MQPVSRQHLKYAPAERAQDARPGDVAFENVRVRVVGSRVDEDSQRVLRATGVAYAKVAAKARLAYFFVYLMATLAQGRHQLRGYLVAHPVAGQGLARHGVQVLQHALRRLALAARGALGVAQELLEGGRTFVIVVGDGV